MKKTLLISSIAALMITSANAIDMTDYKVIEGNYEEAYLNGSLSMNDGNQDQASYNANIQATGKNIYNTAPYSFTVQGVANGSWAKGPNDGDRTEKNYDAKIGATFDKYINNDDTWFVYGSGDLGYRKQASAEKADDPFVKVGVGVGYGRMYDATPLAKAMRISEDLFEYGVIKSELSDEALLQLAEVIDLENDYKSKHGLRDYKKYWFEDMEKAFKSAGILKGETLGAFGIVRIDEILDKERVSGRFHGWRVRGGLGQILSNYDGESKDMTADLQFDYGLPMGHQAQFYEVAKFSQVLDSDSELDFHFDNTMTYTYEISDAIDWENSWLFGYDKYSEGDDVTTNTLSTGFRYYLANRLNYVATLSLNKTDGTNGTSVEDEDWNTKFFTGITYRLK